MQPCKRPLFLEFDDALRKRFLLGFSAAISAALAANCAISSATLGSPVRFIVVLNLNRPARQPLNSPPSASNLILPRRMAHRRIDINAVKDPVQDQHEARSVEEQELHSGRDGDCRMQKPLEQTDRVPSSPEPEPQGC